MRVYALLGVVHGMERADDTAHRFSQRRMEKAVALVMDQASVFHHDLGQDAIGHIAAKVGKRIARGARVSRHTQRRLLSKALAHLPLMLPVFAYLFNDAGKLMAQNDRVLINIIRYALVFAALDGRFVRGHA